MKVSELIAKLQTMNQDAEVEVGYSEPYGGDSVYSFNKESETAKVIVKDNVVLITTWGYDD